MFYKKTLHEIDLNGKRVLVRADYNVPLDKAGRIKPCGGAIPPRLIRDFDIPDSQIVARIRSILRRRPTERTGAVPLHCGAVQMDISRHEVRVGDKPVELTLREFQILRQFLESPGLVLTRQELLNRVWGEDFALEEHALDVHIHALRQKIEEDSSRPRLIVTIRGVGYKLQTSA